MPAYDYTCAHCGHLAEVSHGIHAGGPRFCPQCGAEDTMRKGFAAPAVHFKGSGWAKKDRSASSAAGKSRAAKPAGDADTGSTTDGGSTTGGGASTGGSGESTGGESNAGTSTTPPAASTDGTD